MHLDRRNTYMLPHEVPSVLTAPSPYYDLKTSSDNPSLGDRYGIQCTAYTDEMINPNNVTVSWTGPNGTITNNSRLTIASTISNGTSYTSTLQFSYLSEDDEGEYNCSLVVFGTELKSESIVLGDIYSKLTIYNEITCM